MGESRNWVRSLRKLGVVIRKIGCGQWENWVWSLGKLSVVYGCGSNITL